MAQTEDMLEFSAHIQSASFIKDGDYVIKWTFSTEPPPPDEKYDKVYIRYQNNLNSTMGEGVEGPVIYTPLTQERTPGNAIPRSADISGTIFFRFSSEYIRGEDRHQVMVLMEVTRPEESGLNVKSEEQNADLKTHSVIGKGMFIIHPRPECSEPMEGGMTIYKTKEVVVFARLLHEERLPLVCGRMMLEASLVKSATENKDEDQLTQLPERYQGMHVKEVSTEQSKPRPPPAPFSWDATPVGRSAENTDALESRSQTPRTAAGKGDFFEIKTRAPDMTPNTEPLSVFKIPEEPEKSMVLETPLGEWRESMSFNRESYESAVGMEDVTVIVYGAYNLPRLEDGSEPTPFATLRIVGQQLASGTTHAPPKPTCNPIWHEAMTVTIPDDQVDNCVIELAVNDATQQMLVNYHIPVSFLQPFYNHHLNLVTPVQNSVGAVNLYATFRRKKSKLLPNTGYLPSNGLEIFVHGMAEKLTSPNYPMFLVARIVTSLEEYRSLFDSGGNSLGVPMEMVTFPSPHASWFQAVPNIKLGHPQVSLIGSPADQPQWNHPFVFSHPYDVAAISSLGATLVLELYVQEGPKSPDWKIQNAAGYASIALNKEVHDRLGRGSSGTICFPGNLVEGGRLKTIRNAQPSLDLVLINIPKQDPFKSGSGAIYREPDLPLSPYVPYHRNSQEICSSEIRLEFCGNERRKSDSMSSLDRWMKEYTKDFNKTGFKKSKPWFKRVFNPI